MQALLHYSLADGFARYLLHRTVPYFLITDWTLQPSNYTDTACRFLSIATTEHQLDESLYEPDEVDDSACSRLLETFQFVLDVTGSVVSFASNDGQKQTRPSQ